MYAVGWVGISWFGIEPSARVAAERGMFRSVNEIHGELPERRS
jgi:hypothetical protein